MTETIKQQIYFVTKKRKQLKHADKNKFECTTIANKIQTRGKHEHHFTMEFPNIIIGMRTASIYSHKTNKMKSRKMRKENFSEKKTNSCKK